MVFATQFALFLKAFEPTIGWTEAYMGVILVFLAKSVLPIPGVLELGVRESIAITIFAAFGFGSSGIVPATFAVYLVNIILPTLVGVFAWQGIRLEKQDGEAGE